VTQLQKALVAHWGFLAWVARGQRNLARMLQTGEEPGALLPPAFYKAQEDKCEDKYEHCEWLYRQWYPFFGMEKEEP
jgi:hypothetical protein